MSLKGKIEAIIYAAEEPVTLDQLRGLLGGEVASLLDARAQQQGLLPLHEGGDDSAASQPGHLVPLVSETPELLATQPSTTDAPAAADDPSTANSADQAPAGQDADADAAAASAEEPPTAARAAEQSDAVETPDPTVLPNAAANSEQTPAPESPPTPTAPAALAAPDDRQTQRAARERERAIRELLREHLDELIRDYATGDRGLEIREVANGFRLATRPEYHDAVRGFARSLKPPLKLSLQALETLAVVAYKQPVTAPEVSEIRGVDSGGVLGSLMARKLVVPAGRKQVVGRPILYKTTKEFLLRFGLRDVNELPSIEEFEKLAGELADTEPLQEEIPMADTVQDAGSITGANLREEENATEPQADGAETTEAIEATPVDGRIAGLTPSSEPADPSAAEADLQRDEQAASEGTED